MPDPTDENQTSNKVPNSCVTLIYEAKIAESFRNVSITWSKSLINYSLSISVENPLKKSHYKCKIDLKAWQFWAKKGMKSLQVDENRIDIYWDFRQAKFSNVNPEPSSDYYVALVYEDEVVLVVGDMKKEAFKRTKKRPALEEAYLLCKKEYMYGKKVFSTKTTLNNSQGGKKEHEIVIELSCGIGEPELSISVDSYEVVHVMNLNWRFRGNENVKMNNEEEVQVYWDVHDWLFGKGGVANGLFIFRQMEKFSFDERNRNNHSPLDNTIEFFHVIYACKVD